MRPTEREFTEWSKFFRQKEECGLKYTKEEIHNTLSWCVKQILSVRDQQQDLQDQYIPLITQKIEEGDSKDTSDQP